MATNKVVLNGKTLIDLTDDTVSEETVLKGYKFHKPNGVQGIGSYEEKNQINGLIQKYKVNEGKVVNEADWVEFISKFPNGLITATQYSGNYVKVNDNKYVGFFIYNKYIYGIKYENGIPSSLQSITSTSQSNDSLNIGVINENIFVLNPYEATVFERDYCYLYVVEDTETGFVVHTNRIDINYEGDAGTHKLISLSDNNIILFGTSTGDYSQGIDKVEYLTAKLCTINEDLTITQKTRSTLRYTSSEEPRIISATQLGNENKFVTLNDIENKIILRSITTDKETISWGGSLTISNYPSSCTNEKIISFNESYFCVTCYDITLMKQMLYLCKVVGSTITLCDTIEFNITEYSNLQLIKLNNNSILQFVKLSNDNYLKAYIITNKDEKLEISQINDLPITVSSFYNGYAQAENYVSLIYKNGGTYFTNFNVDIQKGLITVSDIETNGIFVQPLTNKLNIGGIAKTSGTSGEEIEVYVPNL